MKDSPVLEEVIETYEKIKSEKKPYTIKILGKELTVLPNVFSPKYFTDSKYFAEEIPKIVKNKKLLEIGTGTGVVSIFCALSGANVTATDINPAAIKNCKMNVHNCQLPPTEVGGMNSLNILCLLRSPLSPWLTT
ncbi:MAG: methyltransferase [Candidatus Aenigmatarchaeota archaeon]